MLPLRVPPQPLTLPMEKPVLGVTVKLAVAPSLTVVLAGLMLPPVPALALTVWVTAAGMTKLALTLQSAVIAEVV